MSENSTLLDLSNQAGATLDVLNISNLTALPRLPNQQINLTGNSRVVKRWAIPWPAGYFTVSKGLNMSLLISRLVFTIIVIVVAYFALLKIWTKQVDVMEISSF